MNPDPDDAVASEHAAPVFETVTFAEADFMIFLLLNDLAVNGCCCPTVSEAEVGLTATLASQTTTLRPRSVPVAGSAI